MPQNILLIRTVAVLVGIAALLFIYVEAMSAWKLTSEARSASAEMQSKIGTLDPGLLGLPTQTKNRDPCDVPVKTGACAFEKYVPPSKKAGE